jgi:hypothetical protein
VLGQCRADVGAGPPRRGEQGCCHRPSMSHALLAEMDGEVECSFGPAHRE